MSELGREIGAAEAGHDSELLSGDALRAEIHELFLRAEAVLSNPRIRNYRE